MSKFDELVVKYKASMDKHEIKGVSMKLVTAVAKSLGPSIYNKNSQLVACAKAEERDRLKKNYLVKKLGLEDGPKLDKAILDVCAKMGSRNRTKHRPIFYALLAKKFKKTDMYTS